MQGVFGSSGRVLVLGGARSGKSELAERLAGAAGRPVTYVATLVVDRDDADVAERVRRHRERRPAAWTTVEATGSPGLAKVLSALSGTVLVDSLGAWVASAPGFAADGAELASAIASREGTTVVVSDEVGLGVHPSTEVGREFRDALGVVNQQVAAVCDRVLLVVAGRVLELGEPA
jgi:adenosylcobinamide kinase/adenosylcobinamide-phosphate guanylyltransferase